MEFFWLFLCGAFAGVFGGMGMGGGTFLIPLLIILFSVDAHVAAVVNLISFIPMAAVSLFLHAKNGFVKKKDILPIVIPALFSAVGAFFLSKAVSGKDMSRIFGFFLLILSVFSFVSQIKKSRKDD